MAEKQVEDWSNYTGIPTDAQIQQLKADGKESVILGTQFPDTTRQQYDACYKNNFPVEALYCFVYWTLSDFALLDAARKLAYEWGLKVWLDCEWTKTGYPGTGTWAPDATTLVKYIHQYKSYLSSSYQGIYTGRWWWPIYTKDSQDFAGDPLFHAEYGPNPSFDNFQSYGGWTRPAIIQYSDQGVDGVIADLDVKEVGEAPSYWLYGNEQAGAQVVGNRQLVWNKGINVDILGSVDGQRPGEHWHNENENWVQVLP